jgi:hypothetical protein
LSESLSMSILASKKGLLVVGDNACLLVPEKNPPTTFAVNPQSKTAAIALDVLIVGFIFDYDTILDGLVW